MPAVLSTRPRVRAAAVTVAVTALVLVYTQLLLAGRGHRGTPAAILFQALVTGLLNSLTAVGIVLVYRTARVVNFSQTAIGAAGAQLTFQLLQLTQVPFVVAFPAGPAFAAAIGGVFELTIVRRFFRSPRLVLTVATIASAQLLGAVGPSLVNGLPFFPKERDPLAAFGLQSLRSKLPLPGYRFHVGSFRLQFGFSEWLAIEASVALLLLVAAFFRFTRSGVAVRAVADNSERASLLGISVGSLSLIVWTFAGLLSGAGVILAGAINGPAAASGIAPGVLLPALAAAVVARFRSITVAVYASVAIAVIATATRFTFNQDGPLITVGLFLVVGVGLLLQRRAAGRSEDTGGATWEATEEQRPVPHELRGIGSVRATRWGLAGVGLVAVALYPFLVGTGLQNLGAVVALNGILALSLVVLTGWAGQVSLGQYGFAAIGAVVGGALTARAHVPFWVAVPMAAAVTAVVAGLVGVPALRIKGLFLAVTTFAFAVAIDDVLFQRRYFGWLLPGDVKRPSLFFVNFDDERSMYYLCLAALVVAIVVVLNLRRTRFGRILIAVRENEANLQSFGVGATRAKLQAFAISGGLAGLAGAIYATQQRGLNFQSFDAQRSVDLFLLAVLGGVTSTGGVLLGSLIFFVGDYFLKTNVIFLAFQPVFVLLLLYIAPSGLISLINRVRDGALRIVAQRRQLIVPSLFEDYDPEALERRLIPLAEASDRGGLAALPSTQRFGLASELYAGRGRRDLQKLAPPKPTKEAAAIGAAAEAVGSVEESDLEPATVGTREA